LHRGDRSAIKITESASADIIPPLSPNGEALTQVCGITVILLGLLGLFGWILQFEFLTSVLPGRTAVAPTTAVAFILAGLALTLRSHRYFRITCALTVMFLGALALAQQIFVLDFGIDDLLLPQSTSPSSLGPVRMALSSSIAFLLLGGALLQLTTQRVGLRRANETMAVVVGAAALLALIGYSYGTPEYYSLSGFGSMALHSALAFALLALGILCVRADGLAGVFASFGPGADAARRLLPLAILVPLFLGWLVLSAEEADLLSPAQAASAFSATVVLAMTAGVWWTALALNKSHVHRTQAEANSVRLAAIVNSSDDAIIGLDLQGTITNWNKGAENTFGYTATEIIGQAFKRLIPTELQPEASELLARIGRGESVQNFETMRLRKDGSMVDISLTVSPIKDFQGRIVGASKVAHDIRQRKAFEQQILYSEQLHRIAFDQSPAGMAYLGLDGRFIKVNQRICEITGYSDEELLGMSISNLTHKDDLLRDAALLYPFLQGGAGTYENQKRYLCKDGSARWVAVTARMVTDKEGRPQHAVGVIRDIQDQITSDNLLRAKEERYRALTEASATVVWQTTPDGAVVFAGDRWNKITGQTEEEKEGWGWLDAIHPDDRAPTIALWQHSLERVSRAHPRRNLSLVFCARRTDS
jgi:PAS domain S-box-containing protein